MEIIDISLEIKGGMLIYPGDPEPKIKKFFSIPKDKANISLLEIGSHTGTHVDSELHIKTNGRSIDEFPLENFYGNCIVIDLTNKREIKREDLIEQDIREKDIVLLKTENSKEQYEKFRKDFSYITEEVAYYFVKKKIKSVGIDSLSISKFNSNDRVHEILTKSMVIFEGLNLKTVNPGRYIFIGFPLKIKCDGSPVRAVLLKN